MSLDSSLSQASHFLFHNSVKKLVCSSTVFENANILEYRTQNILLEFGLDYVRNVNLIYNRHVSVTTSCSTPK